MGDIQMERIYEQLRAKDLHTVLETLFELNRKIPDLDEALRRQLASAVSALFYVDTVDMPEFTTVLDVAVKTVAAMGPELIPHHLLEMRGTDFKALFCFSRVLSALGPQAIDPILECCEGTEETHLLVGAIYALSKIRDASVAKGFPLVVRLCANPEKEVRDTAVRALGKLIEYLPPSSFSPGDQETAFETLMAATRDPNPGIRAKGVRGLGKMAGQGLLGPERFKKAKERIRQVLGKQRAYSWDTAFIVRREAEEALEHFAD